jgi:hypothetical protein
MLRESGASSKSQTVQDELEPSRLLDHPLEPVIGPVTSGRIRWRVMTSR